MRNFKYLFLGVLLSVFSAITSVNATNYVKDKDLTAETTIATGDTFIVQDISTGNTLKTTLANIYASAANVGASTIVTVGALDSGSITSNFGNIDNGTSNITSGGDWTIDVDGTAIGAAGALNFGAATNDAGIWWDGSDYIITSTAGIKFGVAADDEYDFWSIGTNTMRIDFSATDSETSLMIALFDGTLTRVLVGGTSSGEGSNRVLQVAN